MSSHNADRSKNNGQVTAGCQICRSPVQLACRCALLHVASRRRFRSQIGRQVGRPPVTGPCQVGKEPRPRLGDVWTSASRNSAETPLLKGLRDRGALKSRLGLLFHHDDAEMPDSGSQHFRVQRSNKKAGSGQCVNTGWGSTMASGGWGGAGDSMSVKGCTAWPRTTNHGASGYAGPRRWDPRGRVGGILCLGRPWEKSGVADQEAAPRLGDGT